MTYYYRNVPIETRRCDTVVVDDDAAVFTGPDGERAEFKFRYAAVQDLIALANRAYDLGCNDAASKIADHSGTYYTLCPGPANEPFDEGHETFRALEMVPLRSRSGLVMHRWLCPQCIATAYQNSQRVVEDPVKWR